MTAPAAAATTPTSTALSPAVSRFSEARLVPDTLAMAWRSLITMVRNPGEFYDILIQPVMFTVLFGELFGGAIAGDVKAYLPTIVPGLIIMNALTTSQSVGVDLREDMDKGVFDRFRTMPMSRIAPVLGPMVSDVLRYLICTSLTVFTGYVLGYRPVNGWSGALGAIALAAGCSTSSASSNTSASSSSESDTTWTTISSSVATASTGASVSDILGANASVEDASTGVKMLSSVRAAAPSGEATDSSLWGM